MTVGPGRATAMLRVDGHARIFANVSILTWLCLVTFGLVAAVAILGPWIAPYPVDAVSLVDRLKPLSMFVGEGAQHVLGTDSLGRDVLSRLVVASRASLGVGVAAVLVGCTLGTLLGVVAGYLKGWLDACIMTVADIQLALPTVLVAIGVIAVLGPSLANLIVVIGVTGWVSYARILRSLVLKWRAEEFVVAARAIGATDGRIVRRHILPQCLPTLIVLATLDLPRAIIIEASLSFLGLGIQAPLPSWGNMVADGRAYLTTAAWISVLPGLALVLVTVSVGYLGDHLRDALDPTLTR